MSDLKTTAGVLAWMSASCIARHRVVYQNGEYTGIQTETRAEDNPQIVATAQRIADCVKLAEDPRTKRALRLLAEVERVEREESYRAYADVVAQNILRAALDEPEDT